MNPNSVNKQIKEFLGADPMRPFVLMWSGIFSGIILVTIVIYAIQQSKIGLIRAESAGYQAQSQFLAEQNVTPGNSIQEVMGRIRAQAEAESTRFITDADVPVIIQSISHAANANGVILKKVNSLAPREIQGFPAKSIPIVLQIEGEYSSVGNFLLAVKKATKWFYIVEQARIANDMGRTGRITAELTLIFYSRV